MANNVRNVFFLFSSTYNGYILQPLLAYSVIANMKQIGVLGFFALTAVTCVGSVQLNVSLNFPIFSVTGLEI